MEAPWKDYDPRTNRITKKEKKVSIPDTIEETSTEERGKIPAELNANNEIRELETRHHSKEYLAELEDIRKELPDEIKDFADIFCSKE
jgi:hypothetical protein